MGRSVWILKDNPIERIAGAAQAVSYPRLSLETVWRGDLRSRVVRAQDPFKTTGFFFHFNYPESISANRRIKPARSIKYRFKRAAQYSAELFTQRRNGYAICAKCALTTTTPLFAMNTRRFVPRSADCIATIANRRAIAIRAENGKRRVSERRSRCSRADMRLTPHAVLQRLQLAALSARRPAARYRSAPDRDPTTDTHPARSTSSAARPTCTRACTAARAVRPR